MRNPTDPDAAATALVGIVGAVLLFVVIVLLQAYFYGAEREETNRKLVTPASEELVRTRAEQQELLHSYRWIDQEGGVVGLPIERAMELALARSGSGGKTATPTAR